jgi:hypothetical protein
VDEDPDIEHLLAEGRRTHALLELTQDFGHELLGVRQLVAAGVIEEYQTLDGSIYLLVEGVSLEEAKAAARVVLSLRQGPPCPACGWSKGHCRSCRLGR